MEDLREMARARLPRMVFDFVDGAALTESTARANRRALDSIGIVPGPLRDLGERSSRMVLFGKPSSLPIIIGPTGFNSLSWERGDLGLARAAAAFNIPFVMSHGANVSMEAVRGDGTARQWLQVYLPRSQERRACLVRSASEAGFEALEVTIDTPVAGRRGRDLKNQFGLPFQWTLSKLADVMVHPRWALQMLRQGTPEPVLMRQSIQAGARHATVSELMSHQVNPSLTWDDIKRLRDAWRGPLIVKGIANPRDVARAVTAGVEGIVVSNHGGRQLDGAVASMTLLPACVSEAAGRLSVLVDGGFRSGVDVLKALALGAAAVQIGRAGVYALAAGGQAGVERMLSLLASELDLAMALSFVKSVDEARGLEIRRICDVLDSST